MARNIDEGSACPDPFRPFGKSDPGELNVDSDYVQRAQKTILEIMRKTDRPVFLGRLAIGAHLDLARAHIIVNDLVAKGTVRQATREEKNKYDLPWDAHAFSLIKGR